MEENLKQQPTSTIKIALFGPESTGKTTLSEQLANHFETVWAPEFAREYLQQKWDRIQTACEPEDLIPIAVGQTKLENDTLLTANKFLFCDTNLLVTKVFSEVYYNFCDPALDKAARKHKYDLFFLTDIDVPWEKDDLRDKEADRRMTFEIFKSALIENDKPFITLSGNKQQRFEMAAKIVKDLEKAKQAGFSSYDFVQMYTHGISVEAIITQLDVFKRGIPKAVLSRPATKDDGIMRLSEEDFYRYADYFIQRKHNLKLKKFVPASGAASRMFKFLSEFLNEFKLEEESINAYINRKNASSLAVFLVGMDKLPFYNEVQKALNIHYPENKSWSRDCRHYHFIKLMLSPDHFDFANKPKGILPFHKYPDAISTAVEEHLNECVVYASANNVSHLHFTVSENHQSAFESIISNVKPAIEKRYENQINIKFSYQNPGTDTIAVSLNNEPFRDDDGRLFFRPGGHGALIENLNSLDADIVFVKNIDNVIQNHIEAIARYKNALAGILVELQQQVFIYMAAIDSGHVTDEDIRDISIFLTKNLNVNLIDDFSKYTSDNKISYLRDMLDRPIRICGMVKNEGEPGGGPFWVSDRKGNLSLQIVESTQVDAENVSQIQILKSATHFNPVDLVCGIKNYKGEKFNLKDFIDPNSGFIVEKTKNGKPIKAYELPGLWNGAMANWNTVFVQVPLLTFNPVKTVNDLLKPAHQPQNGQI